MRLVKFRNIDKDKFPFTYDWEHDDQFVEFLLDEHLFHDIKNENGVKIYEFGRHEILYFMKENPSRFYSSVTYMEDGSIDTSLGTDNELTDIPSDHVLIPLGVILIMSSEGCSLEGLIDERCPLVWSVVRKGKLTWKEIPALNLFSSIYHTYDMIELIKQENPTIAVKISKYRCKEIPVLELYVPITSIRQGKFFEEYYERQGEELSVPTDFAILRGTYPEAVMVRKYKEYCWVMRGIYSLCSLFFHLEHYSTDHEQREQIKNIRCVIENS